MGVFNHDIVPFNRGNGRKHNYGLSTPFLLFLSSPFLSFIASTTSEEQNFPRFFLHSQRVINKFLNRLSRTETRAVYLKESKLHSLFCSLMHSAFLRIIHVCTYVMYLISFITYAGIYIHSLNTCQLKSRKHSAKSPKANHIWPKEISRKSQCSKYYNPFARTRAVTLDPSRAYKAFHPRCAMRGNPVARHKENP